MQQTETRSTDRAVDKAPQNGTDVPTPKARRMLPLIQARKEGHLPLIQARKETATVEAAVDKEDVIRSRCEKAAQVGIDVHTHKARKLLCNLEISLEDAILRLSPELKVLVRKKRSTANYGKGDVEVAAHGDTKCTGQWAGE